VEEGRSRAGISRTRSRRSWPCLDMKWATPSGPPAGEEDAVMPTRRPPDVGVHAVTHHGRGVRGHAHSESATRRAAARLAHHDRSHPAAPHRLTTAPHPGRKSPFSSAGAGRGWLRKWAPPAMARAPREAIIREARSRLQPPLGSRNRSPAPGYGRLGARPPPCTNRGWACSRSPRGAHPVEILGEVTRRRWAFPACHRDRAAHAPSRPYPGAAERFREPKWWL